jgi:hypothetical protein
MMRRVARDEVDAWIDITELVKPLEESLGLRPPTHAECQSGLLCKPIMDRFPRGSLPPWAFVAQEPGPPRVVDAAPTTVDTGKTQVPAQAQAPRGTGDLATTCPTCGTLMQPEHSHYRCATCGYRDSCCF